MIIAFYRIEVKPNCTKCIKGDQFETNCSHPYCGVNYRLNRIIMLLVKIVEFLKNSRISQEKAKQYFHLPS